MSRPAGEKWAPADMGKAAVRGEDLLPQVDDYLLIILRGDLLIEEQLERIVRAAAPHPEYLPPHKRQRSFDWSLKMARLLANHLADERTWTAVETIHGFRNDFAHQLEIDHAIRRVDQWLGRITPEYKRLHWISAEHLGARLRYARLRRVIFATYVELVRAMPSSELIGKRYGEAEPGVDRGAVKPASVEPVKRLTVSPQEAAKMLDVDRDTIFRWIKQGKLQASKLSPRIVRIRVVSIEAFLAERAL